MEVEKTQQLSVISQQTTINSIQEAQLPKVSPNSNFAPGQIRVIIKISKNTRLPVT